MPVNVYIPRSFLPPDRPSVVQVEAGDLAQLLGHLGRRFPPFGAVLRKPNALPAGLVRVWVNAHPIDGAAIATTTLRSGDEVSILPSVAGGAGFDEEQIRRYSRHIILPEVGGKGQQRLLASRVLVLGAGGLGSPVALYLAAAGVGTLGIVDFDSVEVSNLQRQIIHRTSGIGQPKPLSAAAAVADLNPDVRVVPYVLRLASDNALDIIRDYDVVVDASDNFPTRYLANDACVLAGKPLIHGSIYRFDGQATVFLPGAGCYRCLFPSPPPPGSVPSCAEAGVLGVLPGIIGTIQAAETIKVLLGIGETLAGRLLVFDALAMEFREVRLRRNPACPVCGDNPTVRELIDYEGFCGLPSLAGDHAHTRGDGR